MENNQSDLSSSNTNGVIMNPDAPQQIIRKQSDLVQIAKENAYTYKNESISKINEVIDYINSQVTGEWGDEQKQEKMDNLFHDYLNAVQQGQPKIFRFADENEWKLAGSPTWGEADTFELWCKGCIATIEEITLPQIRKKLKGNVSEFDLTPFQQSIEHLAQDIKFTDPLTMGKLGKAYYEYNEWDCSMALELLKDYLNGKYTYNCENEMKNIVEEEILSEKEQVIKDAMSKRQVVLSGNINNLKNAVPKKS